MPASTSRTSRRTTACERVLLLPLDPDASAERDARRRCRQRSASQRRAWSSTTASGGRGGAARSASRSVPPACRRSDGPARRSPTCSAARCEVSDRRLRRRDRRRRIAADGPGRRGAAGRAWCAASTGRRADHAGRASWCARRTRICSGDRVARSSRCPAASAAPSWRSAFRVMPPSELAGRRQHRRRFRASRPRDLARHRHAALHAGRPRRSANAAGAVATRPGRSWQR